MFSATLLLGTLNRDKKISVYDGSVINVDAIFYKILEICAEINRWS